MTDVLSRDLPPPKNWQDFERLSFDIYRRQWKTNDAELHGRTGQPQSGVDVYGTDRVEGKFTGVQCKGKDAGYGGAVTEAELRAEVTKALTFQPPLEVFVLVTTAPNDVAIQAVARSLTAENKELGRFEVRVTGWDTLRQYISDYSEVLLKHYRDIAPTDPAGVFAAEQAQSNSRIGRLEQLVAQSNRMLGDIRDAQTEGDELASRISEIANLTRDGFPKAALKGLERLLNDEGDRASPLARFRALANIGNAHLSLGQDDRAKECFQAAYDAYPDYPGARATLAVLRLLEDNPNDAFELASSALNDDPTSSQAAGAYIDSAPPEMPTSVIEAQLGEDLGLRSDVMLHLSIRAHKVNDHEAALRYAERAVEIAPDDWRTLSTLADALMQPLADVDGVSVTRGLSSEDEVAVRRAIDLNKRAWQSVKQRESVFIGRHVAANLIGQLDLIGDEVQSRAILDEAIALEPNYEHLLRKKAQIAASAGNWSEVLSLLSGIPDEALTFDDFVLRLTAHIRLRDVAGVGQSVKGLQENAVSREQREYAETLQGVSAILEGNDTRTIIDELRSRFPTSVLVRATLYDYAGDDSIRSDLVQEIESLSKGDLTLRERLFASETLVDAGRYSLAADVLEPLQKPNDSPVTRGRLEALQLADRRREARALYEALPPEVQKKPHYASIAVNIYERAGLLKPALKLVDSLLKDYDRLSNRLAWAQLNLRLGNTGKLVEWLRDLDEDIEGSAIDLIRVALLVDKFLSGDLKALRLGYRALRSGYSDPQVHLGYAIALFLNGSSDRAGLENPPSVQAGTGVVLISEETGQAKFFIIEESADVHAEWGELATDDPLAVRLLGRTQGESVLIDRMGKDAESHRIHEIQSSYVFAFQRTLRDYSKLFPGYPVFGSIEIDESKGEDKFEQIFALARRRAERAKEIESMYKQGVIPLFMLSKFAGTNVFELWDGLRRVGEIKVAIGLDSELQKGRNDALKGLIIVDPLAIYTWTRLGILSLITKASAKLGIVQSSIDFLREYLHEKEILRGKKTGSFGWDGERYHLIELTEEQLSVEIRNVQTALEFATSLQLVPAEADQDLEDRLAELVSDADCYIRDSLLAVLQSRRVLLTDDLAYRTIASEAGAPTTWTQPFVQVATNENILTAAENRIVVDELAKSNYEFTQFGHLEVLAELAEAGWQINDRLGRFAGLLAKPNVSKPSVVNLLSRLLIESQPYEPTDEQIAAFHVEFVQKATERDAAFDANKFYGEVIGAVARNLYSTLNRNLLRGKLLTTTYHTSPVELAKDYASVARRHARRLAARLVDGGLSFQDNE